MKLFLNFSSAGLVHARCTNQGNLLGVREKTSCANARMVAIEAKPGLCFVDIALRMIPVWIPLLVFLLSGLWLTGQVADAMHGDLDKSGAINAADAVIMRNFLAGNMNRIPARGGQLWYVDSIAGNLRYMPAGTFQQGTLDTDPCTPHTWFAHTLRKNLAVMETEVTQYMWAALREEDPAGFPVVDPSDFTGSMRPVDSVHWDEAILFANRLSQIRGLTVCYYTDANLTVPVDKDNYHAPGQPVYCNWSATGYRLPTEGEWECFCRAGTTTPFSLPVPGYLSCMASCVSSELPELQGAAWYCANAEDITHSAGSKAANPWGLQDVHGNVGEWCWDYYADEYPSGPATDYRGAASGSLRVLRGGSWMWSSRECRSACRTPYSPDERANCAGFRLVRQANYLPGEICQSDAIFGNLRFVPAGTFTQGSLDGDPCIESGPGTIRHTLTRELAAMETEVSQDMWNALRALDPDGFPLSNPSASIGGTLPVESVTWREAVLFANRLSALHGLKPCYYTGAYFPIDKTSYLTAFISCNPNLTGYRLPTEGEWEYLCRAGTVTPFGVDVPGFTACGDFCGAADLPELQQAGWFCANSGGITHAVGQKNANRWGFKDVHGNVAEWCWDFCAVYPAGPVTDYQGPGEGANRIIRGGWHNASAKTCRSAYRLCHDPDWHDPLVGFRLVRTVGPSVPPGYEVLHGDLDKSGAASQADEAILVRYLSGSDNRIPAQTGQLCQEDPIAGNLRWVPAGTFRQGDLEYDPCSTGTWFEHTLSRNLAVMETEVTHQMWSELHAADPSGFPPVDPRLLEGPVPVDMVSWYTALLFANQLSLVRGLDPCYFTDADFTTPVDKNNYKTPDQTYFCKWSANGYRLPSEGEWEYLCRAGTPLPFSVAVPGFEECGEYCDAASLPQLQSVAWYCANGGGGVHPAGRKKANPWGLKDIHGNLVEWCWDWCNENYPAGPVTDYHGEASGTYRVIRGGNWSDSALSCRSACRSCCSPGNSLTIIGFRLVRRLN